MICFGVSNHDVSVVVSFLIAQNAISSARSVYNVPRDKVLKTVPEKKSVLFFLNIADFRRNLRFLNSDAAKGVPVFVFASPIRLFEYSGIKALDFQDHPEFRKMSFNLTKLSSVEYLSHTEDVAVKRNNAHFLSELVTTVKSGSLLNTLMTVIYMLPRASHQTPVKEHIAIGLFRSLTTSEIFDGMADAGLTFSKSVEVILRNLLDSDVANRFRDFFDSYSASTGDLSPNVAGLAKKHDIADFEVRYLLSIVESHEKFSPQRGKTLRSLNKGIVSVDKKKKIKKRLNEVVVVSSESKSKSRNTSKAKPKARSGHSTSSTRATAKVKKKSPARPKSKSSTRASPKSR